LREHCVLIGSFAYIAVCPMLALASLGVAVRDLIEARWRFQPIFAALASFGILAWFGFGFGMPQI
jgi:hypothetical protein